MLSHFSCNRVAPICLAQGQHLHALAEEEEEVAREASGGVQLAGQGSEPAGNTFGHTQQVRS
jgi:hypothetical protein